MRPHDFSGAEPARLKHFELIRFRRRAGNLPTGGSHHSERWGKIRLHEVLRDDVHTMMHPVRDRGG
jgi:hypothetical protein